MTRAEAYEAARARWHKRGAWVGQDVTYRGKEWPCAVGVHENRDPLRTSNVRQYVLGVGKTWEEAFAAADRRAM